MEMPKVTLCSAAECAYNSDSSCHALAITVGDPGGPPSCDTYFKADNQGGDGSTTAGVGACKMGECLHNDHYECSAASIKIDFQQGYPDCLVFQPRQS